jgi:hypothetical protein
LRSRCTTPRRVETVEHLAQDVERLEKWKGTIGEARPQIATGGEIRDERNRVALDHEVAQAHDVRIVQAHQDRALPEEPFDDVSVLGED